MHDRYFITEIKSIQQNGKEVDEAETGEVGIKIDQKTDMNSEIWRRKLK
jgi:translation initiation factor IF-2